MANKPQTDILFAVLLAALFLPMLLCPDGSAICLSADGSMVMETIFQDRCSGSITGSCSETASALSEGGRESGCTDIIGYPALRSSAGFIFYTFLPFSCVADPDFHISSVLHHHTLTAYLPVPDNPYRFSMVLRL